MAAALRLRQLIQCMDITSGRQDTILSQGSGLCAQCEQMDFVSLTREECPLVTNDCHFHLGPVKHLLAKPSCPGCRLILATISSSARNKADFGLQELEIGRRYVHVTVLEPNETKPISTKGTTTQKYVKSGSRLHMESLIEVGLRPPNRREAIVTGTILRSENTPISDVLQPVNVKFRARAMPSTISISLVKHWIELCHAEHIECRFEGPAMPKIDNFRLIDIQEQKVISSSQTERYAALSYVWGPTTAPMLTGDTLMRYTSPCGLRQCPIPQSILDAMQLLRELGERFLWVDTLCIVQDDPNDRAQQLSIMDSIFQSAYIVVVAAAGSDAYAGLPGVQSTRCIQKRQTEIINGVQFITAQPALQDALEETIWKTRGWTFQESLVASRLLVFTENQVYWSCRTSSWREDASGELSMTAIDPDETNSFRTSSARLVECRTRAYCRHVVSFSKRTFKDDRDVLWGFMGILKLHASLFPQGFIWGMPYEQLDVTLLWYEAGPCPFVHNRQTYHTLAKESSTEYLQYPSWSWLSAKTAVDFVDSCGCRIVSEVSWHKSLLLVESKTQEDTTSKEITDFGRLQFTAQTTELRLVREKPPSNETSNSEPEHHLMIQIWANTALHTPSGKAIGTLKVPNSFFNGSLERSGEVVLLSSNAKTSEEIREVSVDDPQHCVRHTRGCKHIQSHNIMLIEWVDGIAYRRGLGKVEKADWAQVETREKCIILG